MFCDVTSKKKHLPSAQFTVSEPGEGIVHKIHCKAEADNEVPGQSNMFKRWNSINKSSHQSQLVTLGGYIT